MTNLTTTGRPDLAQVLNDKIAELATHEQITTQLLGELSRELLIYYVQSGDVRPINRILGLANNGKFVLSAINWRLAIRYFLAFIPHKHNREEVNDYGINGGRRDTTKLFKFGEKASERAIAKKKKAIAEWLIEPTNDLWVWQGDVKIDDKPKDLTGRITKAINKALEGDDKTNTEAASAASIVQAILDSNIDPEQMLQAMAAISRAEAA
jgi:hypothetical protein